MADAGQKLTDLRHGIDEIDAKLHDLLMRRSALVEEIAQAKSGDGAILRPGREAKIIRRLLARHEGGLSAAAVVRIWREIIAASICLQGPFSVALSEADSDGPLGGLTQAHFGTVVPISSYRSEGAVVQAVMERRATAAVLSLPGVHDGEPWWRFLAHPQANTPRVIARLPFFAASAVAPHEALVIAVAPAEESGDDRSLLLLETREELSRTALRKRLKQAGFSHQTQAIWDETAGRRMHLVEVDGFVGEADPRLRRLSLADDGLFAQRHVVGAFAVPLTASGCEAEVKDECEERA